MKVTYTYKGTKLIVEQRGGINQADFDELALQMATQPQTVRVCVVADDGTVFYGTQEELNQLIRLQGQIFKPSTN